MRKNIARLGIKAVVAGIVAASLLCGCGAPPQETTTNSSGVDRTSYLTLTPTEDPREIVDPFEDFEVAYFETIKEIPVILGGQDILKNTNYSISKEEKEAELRRQEQDNKKYGEHTVLRITGRHPYLEARVVDTHNEKSEIYYYEVREELSDEVNEKRIVVTANIREKQMKKYRFKGVEGSATEVEKSVPVENLVARYLTFSLENQEDNEKIWTATKSEFDKKPFDMPKNSTLDKSLGYAGTEDFGSEAYPKLTITSWEAICPIGVVARCDLTNWKDHRNMFKDAIDFPGCYLLIYSDTIVEHSDGRVTVEEDWSSERFSIGVFSSREIFEEWLGDNGIHLDYVIPMGD